jgi:hypothetical protein
LRTEAVRRRSKFGNVRTVGPGGFTYDSRAEAERAQGLVILQRAGKILSWERGKRVKLIDRGVGRRVTYRPDFIVHGLMGDWTEDVKGKDRRTGRPATMTEVFRVKALLYMQKNVGPPLVVVDSAGIVMWEA